MPYEKIGDNEPICIAEEVPFEIPKNWEICRLKDICYLLNGDKHNNENLPILDAKFLRGRDTSYKTNGIFVKKNEKIILVDGENSGEVFIAPTNGYLGSTFKILWISNNIYENYVLKFIGLYHSLLKNSKKGAAIPHLNKDIFYNLIFPLPPLAEQERIVNKIKELEPYIKDYDIAYEKIEKLNKDFPEQLKKSILQDAVQGKLVPQDKNDEPSSVLIEKIRQEKAQLIKDKKIKKDKNESYIFRRDNSHYEKIGNEERCIDDEIPFDIPDNWEWVRLGNISNYGSCINIESIDIPDKMWILDLEDIEKDTGRLLTKKTKKEVKTFSTKHRFYNRQILYSKLRPYLNKVIIADEDGCCTSEILPITFYGNIYPEYTQIFLMSPYFVSYANQCSYGVKMPRLGTEDGKNAFFALPPLSEQKRIVEKIQTLMPIIEIL